MQVAVTGVLGRLGGCVVKELATHMARLLGTGAPAEYVADLRDLDSILPALRGVEAARLADQPHGGAPASRMDTHDAMAALMSPGSMTASLPVVSTTLTALPPALHPRCARSAPFARATATAVWVQRHDTRVAPWCNGARTRSRAADGADRAGCLR